LTIVKPLEIVANSSAVELYSFYGNLSTSTLKLHVVWVNCNNYV